MRTGPTGEGSAPPSAPEGRSPALTLEPEQRFRFEPKRWEKGLCSFIVQTLVSLPGGGPVHPGAGTRERGRLAKLMAKF